MQDHMSGRSRGFGFVTFEEDSSAERAFAAGPMHEISGKQVEVKPATPKGTGPQPSTRIAAGRGRPSGEYEPTPMMPFPGALPTTPPFSPYGMYAGYPGRPGMVPPPYGMPQYPQYMLMQPSMPGFPPATPAYGAYPQPYSGPGRGQGGGAMPIPFSRPSPGQQQQQQQQQQGGYYYPSPSPSPPSQSTQKSGQGRNKVDSASSLDQHAERFQKMRLHD